MLQYRKRIAAVLPALALLLSSMTGAVPQASAAQPAFADPAFQKVWEYSDKAVAEGKAARSWTWGPTPNQAQMEPYKEAPGGQRQVQYFDKARMEINNPNGDRTNPFYVTNGRLVVEMLSGRIQTGDNQYDSVLPAEIPVAGDTVGGSFTTPTYATLYNVANIGGTGARGAQIAPGTAIRSSLDRFGNTGTVDAGVPQDARSTVAIYVPETGHNIPKAFWDFLNQRGPTYQNGAYKDDTVVNWVFAMGYPITEPYWTQIRVAGKDTWVLFQAFERRVLTFNPGNPAAFQVEMGNVGLHYRDWRYAPVPTGCPATPVRGFGTVWANKPGVAANVGCPSDQHETVVQSAIQHFEHGTMIYVNPDPLGAKKIFVLFDDGTFASFDDTWAEGQPAGHNQTPPAGRFEPVRGFGKVWFEGTGARVRERLGWATDQETGGAGARQSYARGTMYWVGASNQILVLYQFTATGQQVSRWQLFNDTFNTP